MSSRVYNSPLISFKNIIIIFYNTDDFPPLLWNELSCQSASVCIYVKPRQQNSKIVSFSYMVNPRIFEKKKWLYVLLKGICFLFNQIMFLSLILGLLFCHVNHLFVQHLFHRMHVRLLSLLLLYLQVTVKTI